MERIDVKRGDTYVATIQYVVGGIDQPLDGTTIASHWRTKRGDLVLACSVTLQAPRGDGHVYDARIEGTALATGAVAAGTYVSDIRYTWPDGRVDTTENFEISVTEAQTHE